MYNCADCTLHRVGGPIHIVVSAQWINCTAVCGGIQYSEFLWDTNFTVSYLWMKLLSVASPSIANAVCVCVCERERLCMCVCVHMHTHAFKAEFTQLKGSLVKQGWLQQEAHAHLIRALMMELRCPPSFPPFCHSATKVSLAFEHWVY